MWALMTVPPFEPGVMLAIAIFNPAVILVAALMGRQADQWQKLIVAGFAAAMAGAVLVWLGTFAMLLPSRGMGSDAGIFVVSFLYGTLIASLVYLFWPRRKNET